MTKTYSYNHLLTLFNDIAYDYRFLFQGLTDHPPRHSFPTRRGSSQCLPYSGFRWNSGPHLLAVSGQECYLKTATHRLEVQAADMAPVRASRGCGAPPGSCWKERRLRHGYEIGRASYRERVVV